MKLFLCLSLHLDLFPIENFLYILFLLHVIYLIIVAKFLFQYYSSKILLSSNDLELVSKSLIEAATTNSVNVTTQEYGTICMVVHNAHSKPRDDNNV